MALLALLVLLGGPIQADVFSGRVVGVMDGDTLEVLRDGALVRVRLACVDSPEKGQPSATLAKQFTSTMAFGKTVTVRVAGHDRYGRELGQVTLEDGDNLNQKLLRTGLAWHYAQGGGCADEALFDLERQARAARVGLWAHQPQVAPWEFRKEPLPGVAAVAAAPTATATPGAKRLAITNADLPRSSTVADEGSVGSSSGRSSGHAPGTDVHVRGYTRKNGSYVPPHTRAAPGHGSSSSSRGSSRR